MPLGKIFLHVHVDKNSLRIKFFSLIPDAFSLIPRKDSSFLRTFGCLGMLKTLKYCRDTGPFLPLFLFSGACIALRHTRDVPVLGLLGLIIVQCGFFIRKR